MKLVFTALFVTFTYICENAYGAQDDLLECPLNLERNSDLWTYRDWCFQVYIFNHHGLHNHDWFHARDDCRRRGGELLQIRDAETQAFVRTRLYEQHYEKTWRFWIGASDHRQEGHWKWVAAPSDMDYSYWSPGQGTDQHGFLHIPGGLTEDCAVLDTQDHARWHDYPCASGVGFWFSHICQFGKRKEFQEKHWNKTSTPFSDTKTKISTSRSRPKTSASLVTKSHAKSSSSIRQSSTDSGIFYPTLVTKSSGTTRFEPSRTLYPTLVTKSSGTARAEPSISSNGHTSSLSVKVQTSPTEETESLERKSSLTVKSTFFTKLFETTKIASVGEASSAKITPSRESAMFSTTRRKSSTRRSASSTTPENILVGVVIG